MKKGIHPEVHPITVIFTNGEQREMLSTYGKPDEMVKVHLESDRFNHPAWNPGLRVSSKKNSRAARFLSKFGDL
ncbi:50S ribosomal protein L31 [Anaplasma marginale]|nr:50S ribosomal protein L31 [Anaplasma marginale]AXW83745.1 50S ribosomal protein L31 [Anaplasma marginale]AXW84665.1 50S ribosomal protein L31 [Anaplasma marginale]KAA8472158.1 50S ribosomal protein L31 [Anaplasma marginale]KAA8473484.1 50S ribosomal protein L31 [Anaplasma marginale]KAB0450425.1 50S ribosomal protein L31 [Anaplasma marginale]